MSEVVVSGAAERRASGAVVMRFAGHPVLEPQSSVRRARRPFGPYVQPPLRRQPRDQSLIPWKTKEKTRLTHLTMKTTMKVTKNSNIWDVSDSDSPQTGKADAAAPIIHPPHPNKHVHLMQ